MSKNNASANTTTNTYLIGWTEKGGAKFGQLPTGPVPWYGPLLVWIDLKVAHQFCWNRWIPGLGPIAFRYCQWSAVQFDRSDNEVKAEK